MRHSCEQDSAKYQNLGSMIADNLLGLFSVTGQLSVLPNSKCKQKIILQLNSPNIEWLSDGNLEEFIPLGPRPNAVNYFHCNTNYEVWVVEINPLILMLIHSLINRLPIFHQKNVYQKNELFPAYC